MFVRWELTNLWPSRFGHSKILSNFLFQPKKATLLPASLSYLHGRIRVVYKRLKSLPLTAIEGQHAPRPIRTLQVLSGHATTGPVSTVFIRERFVFLSGFNLALEVDIENVWSDPQKLSHLHGGHSIWPSAFPAVWYVFKCSFHYQKHNLTLI